ncbi:hypothetical protein BSKO_10758 [Bryopsis sp. KO-2023]|nr:hypothetical protein BSKO_10758 [Bryopsis sp. KO-2023]
MLRFVNPKSCRGRSRDTHVHRTLPLSQLSRWGVLRGDAPELRPIRQGCPAINSHCGPSECFIPVQIFPIFSMSLATHTEILLDWLRCLLCLIPMGTATYYLYRGWCESQALFLVQHVDVEDSEPPDYLYGIDVSQSVFMRHSEVRRAVEFAAKAHSGQFRKSGQPYVSHCIETALIFELLLSPSIENARAEPAFIAAILHDVLDDTDTPAEILEKEFGPTVCGLAQQVSELSSMIQLLRRHRRINGNKISNNGTDSRWREEESSRLKSTILKKMEEPLVLLIKLADRLHNMRTVFALKPEKRKAVAQETQVIFCTLAERLGLFELKAELEDLCFGVLQPMEFSKAHYDVETLWSSSHKATVSNQTELPAVTSHQNPVPDFWGLSRVPLPLSRYGDRGADAQEEKHFNGLDGSTSGLFFLREQPSQSNAEDFHLGSSCALSSDAQTDDQCEELLSWIRPFTSVTFRWSGPGGDMGFGQNFLRECTEKILHEIALGSFGAGFNIDVTGRVKSLYSAYNKTKRKGLSRVSDVLDLLALRVVVGDDSQVVEATELCYIMLSTVHRLWKPVHKEFDDYIASPKDSGYQSLHTAVIGPGGVPFEVQIRTSSMHTDAEYGSAAHWCYKESPGVGPANETDSAHLWQVGQPVWRIQSGRYLDGVVVQCDKGGRHVLVAVYLDGVLPRAPGRRAASIREYEKLLKHVREKGWFEAGHGDFFVALERYVLCVDGAHHRVDHYGQKEGKTVVRPIRTRDVLASMDDDSSIDPISSLDDKTVQVDMARVQRLRLGLEYYNDVCTGVAPVASEDENIFVMVWPEGRIVDFPRGTSAGDVLQSKGLIEVDDGFERVRGPPVVNVNNQLVPEDTALKDGDFLVLTREKIRI